MTLTRDNLKILKPELLGDSAQAGGQRTNNEVVSGEINQLVKAISDIDHAQSAISIAKFFPALVTDGTETLIDGHIFVSEPPLDPLVSFVIAESAGLNDSSRMSDMIELLEGSVRAGAIIREGLIGLLEGQGSFPRAYLQSSYMFNGTEYWANEAIRQGEVVCISVEYSGNESATYPRFEHFCQVTETVTGGAVGQVNFQPPIPYDTPDTDVVINGESKCTKLRRTSVNPDVIYHGVSKLTAENSGNSIEVETTTTELLPKVRQVATHTGQSLSALGTSDVPTALVKKVAQTPRVNGQYTYIFQVPDIINTDFVNNVLGLKPRAVGLNSSYSWTVTITGTTATCTANIGALSGTIGGSYMDSVTLEYVSSNRYTYFDSTQAALPSTSKITVGTVVMSIEITSTGSTYVLSEQGDGLYTNGRKYVELDYADGTITKFPDADGDFSVSYLCLTEPGLPDDNAVVFNLSVAEPVIDSFYMTVSSADGLTLLSASADENGVVTGTAVSSGSITGNLVDLSFAQDVDLTSLRYNIDEITTLTPPPELYGLNPLRLPNGGVVPIFTEWNVIVIEHVAIQAIASASIGATYNVRQTARFVDITDATGASLWTVDDTHYSHDSATGIVTLNSDFSGFTAPFVLTDIIGEEAMVTGIDDGELQLAAELKSTYPVGSIVASVQNLGDLQAYVGPVRDMTAWGNNWDQDGTNSTGSLNSVDYPIEVNNLTSINEDWALIFTSSTAFRCVGRRTGQVATGDTLNDFAPINPNTLAPYFVIRAGAFGGGWNTGEAIRFETYASSKPGMLIRSVASGHSQITTDRAVLAFRGNES